jgi:hypothetical protein
MADDTSVGSSLLIPRQKYMTQAANLGPDEVEYDGITYKICMAELMTYHISASHLQEHGALVDHGTNGGIAGANCCIIKTADQAEHYVNIKGIGDHVIAKRCLVSVGAVTQSNQGPVIVLMHQYALVEDGMSIHSSLQKEWNQVSVDDWS